MSNKITSSKFDQKAYIDMLRSRKYEPMPSSDVTMTPSPSASPIIRSSASLSAVTVLPGGILPVGAPLDASRPSPVVVSPSTQKSSAGWHKDAPRGAARTQMAGNCGSACFLLPEEKKFPICAKCNGTSCSCYPDCRALKAAEQRGKSTYTRTGDPKYAEVAARALQMHQAQCSGKQPRPFAMR